MATLKDALAAATADILKMDVAQKWLEQHPSLEAERKTMAEALAELGNNLAQKMAEVADLNKRSITLASEIAEMESERTQLAREQEQRKSTTEEANKRLAQLQENIEKLGEQKLAITSEVNALNEQHKLVEERVKDLAGKREDLQKEIERLKTEIEKLESKRAEALEYDAKAKNLDSLNKLLKSTTDLQKSVSDTNQLMMKDLATIAETRKKGPMVLRQAAFEGIVKNPVFTTPSADQEFESETQALDGMKNYVRNIREYDLPERLLYAFHTSLKTSDISSLTVMAGVSGTGKSALPDLYAKAMGIHLVTLAVEPRWDSPKDLLGFFNYVTNRYEPTPLAKALFQFQGHHPQEGLHPDPDLSEYMLMAMLDEMNLARIEYYFSEFLSKLELRRGGRLDDTEHRRRVAMEIFAGANGLEKEGENNQEVEFREKPIQLFANYNTLFVGTMNEDETTQSLSDKVLDRANVLYFGRPNNLKPMTADKQNGTQKMLKRATWKNWKQEVTAIDTQENGRWQRAEEQLQELNDQLASLGRPFAHRSYQAMLSYLANYPYEAAGIDESDTLGFFKRPLADQIGMRIMPKLRGLDLTQHAQTLELVGKTVQRIGDDTLNTAFDNAVNRQKNRSGFFHWQGLDWAYGEDS
ncbi:MAG: hypothetical protein M0P27_00540 [Bacteroidales bacterium]|nr:hypothetical protein [Bacteroidales bacterium]